MCPLPVADRNDFPRAFDEFIPYIAAQCDDYRRRIGTPCSRASCRAGIARRFRPGSVRAISAAEAEAWASAMQDYLDAKSESSNVRLGAKTYIAVLAVPGSASGFRLGIGFVSNVAIAPER